MLAPIAASFQDALTGMPVFASMFLSSFITGVLSISVYRLINLITVKNLDHNDKRVTRGVNW